MPIIDDLRKAFINSVTEYRNEKRQLGKPINQFRLDDLARLDSIIEESRRENNQDAPTLRANVETFINTMQVSWLANISSTFDSQLRQKLKAVLNQPEYSEKALLAKERTEAKERETRIIRENAAIINNMDGASVIRLKKQVEDLEEKLNVEATKVTELQQIVKQRDNANSALQEYCQTLVSENEKLLAENQQLKERLKQYEPDPATQPTTDGLPYNNSRHY